MARQRARHRSLRNRPTAGWLVALTATTVLGGCASRTDIELASAQGPAVQAVDGAGGQNEADVVEAGAVELDDLPLLSTTVAPESVDAASTSTSTSTEPPDAAAMIKELCSRDRRYLRTAIEGYRDEYGTPPTSEGELLATGYVQHQSDVYDVQADGSIVASDDTCGK